MNLNPKSFFLATPFSPSSSPIKARFGINKHGHWLRDIVIKRTLYKHDKIWIHKGVSPLESILSLAIFGYFAMFSWVLHINLLTKFHLLWEFELHSDQFWFNSFVNADLTVLFFTFIPFSIHRKYEKEVEPLEDDQESKELDELRRRQMARKIWCSNMFGGWEKHLQLYFPNVSDANER